jgi:signal transduction histidine kinase
LDGLGGLRDLRRLKLIGVGAPVVFLVGFEVFRLVFLDPAFQGPTAHLVAGGIVAVAAIGFGLVIFLHVERAQREIVRRNRDLAIVTAVSVAVRGELDIDQVLNAALAAIADRTGASLARVTVHASESGEPEREIVIRRPEADWSDALADPGRSIEIPLPAGATTIGRLHLHIPAQHAGGLPSDDALQAVGHQLAAAIQIGQLVGDLHRRRDEGHLLYQTLLQISNQAPLPEILATIVDGARARLEADQSCVCLTTSVLRSFEGDHDLSDSLAAGIGCGSPQPGRGMEAHVRDHRCAIGSSADYASTLHVPVWSPGELLGDLWLARREGPLFTERDRRYLITLAGLAAIAIAAARLRENERQGAILAERDRIARELHDSLAQVLGSTHLRLRAQLARPDLADRPKVAAELQDLAEITEEAYRDVREAILGLREASRSRGLVESLDAFLEKYSHQSGVKASLETTLDHEPDLPTRTEIQVIRVIQEALANVRKHARATHAKVRVSADAPGEGLTIVIEDDGRGFDPSTTTVHRDGGYGLQTMRERMELAGGTLRVDSAPGRGTRVVAILPEAPRVPGTGQLADHR